MKDLQGSAADSVAAPIERCFALLAAVEEYPQWHPEVVRVVNPLERLPDGHAGRAGVTLAVARGPLTREFELTVAVRLDPPGAVTLTRLPNEPGDPEEFEVRWRLEAGRGTRIALDLEASLDVPRLTPLGGLGDALAAGFVAAAVRALNRSR